MLVADLCFAAFHLSIPFGHDIQSGFGASGYFGERCEESRALG
jgi:hypothetical protein